MTLNTCISESIERYCMQLIPDGDLVLCKLDDLPNRHKINCFNTYTPEQYKENSDAFINPYEDEILWTKIYNSKVHEDYIYNPASLVYLPFELQKNVAETSSTGVAAHLNISEAIASGILELIERDTLMINHFQDLNPPELDINSVLSNVRSPDFIRKILSNYNVKIYKLFSDIKIPIFLAYVWTDDGGLHLGIGASASLDAEQGIFKAFQECLFTYFYSKNMLHLRKTIKDDISSLYEHFLYYQSNYFFGLIKNRDVIQFENVQFNPSYLDNQLSENNLDVYYKNLTTPDIESLPIQVVKVVIPGLIDLNKSFKLRRLGARRFWEVPGKLGLRCSAKLFDEPHPFPYRNAV
ncbi:YcaO-like family protein [Microcoleus sp. D3_18a_C4]|uniref:YcaO-like family protein n=1 Tax=Microcoleus sp. D3_18a_C4 TaxID=3055332 RepID=UPI002FD3A715